MRGCIELKIGKWRISTIFKLLLFLLVVGSFIYVVSQTEESDQVLDNPAAPEVPVEEEEPVEEEGEGDTIPEEVIPEQVVEDAPLEETRPLFLHSKQEKIDNHPFLIENDHYELYLNEENLSIILRNKHSGALMYSTVQDPIDSNESWKNFTQSGIVMEYLVDTNIVVYQADMYSENPKKKITNTESGFIASIHYPELQISFDVHVQLTDKGITVEIPQETIIEESDKYKMASLYIYPFLGYSILGERNGYMFIPDGSGALIHLKDNNGKFKQPYSDMVYGENVGIDESYVLSLFNRMNPFNDPENILMPVFGMIHTDSEFGYLGIIEEGQFSAKIEAYPSGAILPYNWITSKFIYRQVYNQPTSQDTGTMVVRQKNRNNFDIKVHYQFVQEEYANYMGLASLYREYLVDNNLVEKKDIRFQSRIDFLGAEVEQGLIRKKEVPMTTFDSGKRILEDLQDRGVNNILSIYKGWQNKGIHGGLPILSSSADKSLENEVTLEDFIQFSQENNIDMYLYHDALRFNSDEFSSNRHKLMKKFNKRTHEEKVYGNVYEGFQFLHPESTMKILERMNKEYEKANIDNVMIGGITNHLFSYSDGNKEQDRIKTKSIYEEVITDYDERFNLLLEQPFSYLWDKTEALIDVPISSSNYVFTDEDIPFISLTLRGLVPMYAEYTNFQANQEEFFLQLVEQGLYPSFYITDENPSALKNTNSSDIYSSEYERYEEMIPSYHEELQTIHETVGDAVIINHEKKETITKVTFSNDTIIYVNYADEVQEIDGYTLDGLSYKVVTN